MHREAINSITFIGTGGGRVVRANQMRSFGGLVIKLNNCQIQLDPGPGSLTRMSDYKLYPARTKIIFVSHSHIDHANDVNALVDSMTLGGINKRGTLISVPSVLAGDKEDGPWLRNFYRGKLNQVISVSPGDKIKVRDLNFVATKTKHDEEYNVGLRIEFENFVLGYTSDTAYFKGLAKEFKGSTVLIINVLRPGIDRWKTHMCTDDAVKLVEEVKPELAIITHFGAKMLRANPLYEAREIQKRTGVRTLAATDGFRVSLDGFIQNPTQTTL